MNIDKSRSYATETLLQKGLAKYGLADLKPVIVRNREGRWTAIFGWELSGVSKTGDMLFAARHGFMTIN